MRGWMVAVVALAGACDDECARELAGYCARRVCESYEERVAGTREVDCGPPPAPRAPETSTWSCGGLRAVSDADGFGGSTELYDAEGRLVGALVSGDTPDERGCFETRYGAVGCEAPPRASRRCLVPE